MNYIKLDKARWVLGAGLILGSLGLATYGIASPEGLRSHSEHDERSGYKRENDREERDREYYRADRHDKDENSGYSERSGRFDRNAVLSDGRYSLYQEECSACHLAYPAQLLPERSWQAIMQGLDDHFGENATLDTETRQVIESYLVRYASEASGDRYARKLSRYLDETSVPMRITELPYFKDEHEEIPASVFADNAELNSFSQCSACHGAGAERGDFDDDRINIPGYGRWDD